MKVLILAAGYGTRLYPLTKDKPKPLLPINGKPLLNYLIEKFQGVASVNEIIVVTNEKFFVPFENWAKENKTFPIPLRVINDGTKTPQDRLGSIGDICFVLKEKNIQEDLLVLGGDNLFDSGLTSFLDFASGQNKRVSVGLFDIKDIQRASQFGVAAMDDNHQVIAFDEKPVNPKTSLIAMCLYFLPKHTLSIIREYVNEGGKQDLAGDYIGWLCGRGQLCGFRFEGKWYDIGNLEAYDQAQKEFQTTP